MRLQPAAAAAAMSILTVSLLTATAAAQSASLADSASVKEPEGLPADLIRVDGGRVTLGSTAKSLLEIAEKLQPRDERARAKVLHKLLPELGQRTEQVDAFYLNRFLVTNEQYKVFVDKTGHRFPFHWWRYGKPAEYNEALPKVREAFPDEKGDAPLVYWEQKWRDLPFAIPEGAEKLPVIFVSYDDAVAFCGWAGMRLPTEEEWVFAATPEPASQYLWGEEWIEDRKDRSRDSLEQLGLRRSPDQKLKPVGTCQFATGRFGHADLAGQVWEWTLGREFGTIVDRDAFEKEFKKLPKAVREEQDKMEPTKFSGLARVIKGGAYFSWSSPEEFRIQIRAPLAAFQTVEGVGFRTAKSLIPARDTTLSRLRTSAYDLSVFGGDREPEWDAQVGMERYTLGAGGSLIEDYHAVSFVPVNHMGFTRQLGDLAKVKLAAQEQPIAVGTLLTTEPLSEPALEPGLYTVYFRPAGMPDELVKALRDGSKELLAAKAKGETVKEEKKDEDAEGDKKSKGADWRSVLSKYGITEEEATVKSAHTVIKYVRMKQGSLQVDTESAQFVFRAPDGRYVAAMPTQSQLSVTRDFDGATMERAAGNLGRLTFKFASKWDAKTKSKHLGLELPIVLKTTPAAGDGWRLPK